MSRSDWKECARVADVPAVHEALLAFSEDPTGDNGVEVVRAVIDAVVSRETTGPLCINVPRETSLPDSIAQISLDLESNRSGGGGEYGLFPAGGGGGGGNRGR